MSSTLRRLPVLVLSLMTVSTGCDMVDSARNRFTTTDTISTIAGSGLTLGLEAPPNLGPGDQGALRVSLTNRTDSVISNVRLQLIVPGWTEPLTPRPGEPPVTLEAMNDGTTIFTYLLDDRPLQPGQVQAVEQRIRVPSTMMVTDSTLPWTNTVRARLLSAGGDALAEVETRIGPDSVGGSSGAQDTIARRDRLGAAQLGMTVTALKSASSSARDTSWSAGGAQQRGVVIPVGSGTAVAVLERDAVARIEVTNRSVRTAEGLGVGSSVAELRAAYGEGCANIEDGVFLVWFPDASGIVFALDAPARNPGQVADQLPPTARVTRWWLQQGGESCAG
jgi:hypothetical protein